MPNAHPRHNPDAAGLPAFLATALGDAPVSRILKCSPVTVDRGCALFLGDEFCEHQRWAYLARHAALARAPGASGRVANGNRTGPSHLVTAVTRNSILLTCASARTGANPTSTVGHFFSNAWG